jgi:hypothetical protein
MARDDHRGSSGCLWQGAVSDGVDHRTGVPNRLERFCDFGPRIVSKACSGHEARRRAGIQGARWGSRSLCQTSTLAPWGSCWFSGQGCATSFCSHFGQPSRCGIVGMPGPQDVVWGCKRRGIEMIWPQRSARRWRHTLSNEGIVLGSRETQAGCGGRVRRTVLVWRAGHAPRPDRTGNVACGGC